MASNQRSAAQANLKLTLWNAEAEATRNSDFYEWLQDLGLPEEGVTRLHDFTSHTMMAGKKIIAIGKILLVKVIDFFKAHPFLVAGAGVAAVFGSAIYSLIISIPFLGQILEPIARALGFGIVATGAIAGHMLDKKFGGVGQNIVEVADEFFQFLADTLNTVFCEVASAQLSLSEQG